MFKKLHWIALSVSVFIFLCIAQVSAQDSGKSYFYKEINTEISINEDTTFDVVETQTFSFKGNFHNAFRVIPLDKVDAITDIQVIDASSGNSIEFNAFREDGEQRIEWSFDITDADHSWILKYKVHGGLGFYKDHDELYWNLLTDYTVPVERVRASVSLPSSVNIDDLSAQFYSNENEVESITHSISPEGIFLYEAEGIRSGADLTIAAGWPKDIVDQGKYWIDFLKIYWGYILSILAVLGTLLYLLFYWFVTEKYKQGRGTVVPEYDPPQKLRPAMAEVIVKEGITAKAWPASVIDLAVRGYVKISEEKSAWYDFGKNYRIDKAENHSADDHLLEYEKSFLNTLFLSSSKGYFSTKELKKDFTQQTAVSKQMIELESALYKETEHKTGAYEKPLSKDPKGFLLFGFAFGVFAAFIFLQNQALLFMATIALCVLFVVLFRKFEARLNKQGQILKEEWLGFKMYLETAERYRMQNLTPEIFEKYLPYAIIFGVEKKWGKAFDSLNVPPPSWYAGAYAASGISSDGAGGFSAGAFSTSFSSSFASAFSSSGGGGASGGGGSAGGGGGGGGGGAS